MDEKGWLEGLDSTSMLHCLQSMRRNRRKQDRIKLRLFAVECARRVEGLMTDRGIRGMELGNELAEEKPRSAECDDLANFYQDYHELVSRTAHDLADEAGWATVFRDVALSAFAAASNALGAIGREAQWNRENHEPAID